MSEFTNENGTEGKGGYRAHSTSRRSTPTRGKDQKKGSA